MPPTARTQTQSGEGGFTLVELLVVILVVGILAAIALPTYLGQQNKGNDANAKGNVRNLVTHVESCFSGTEDYRDCDSEAELGTTGMSFGAGHGQVEVSSGGQFSFTIVGHSRSGNTFTLEKSGGGRPARTCTTAGRAGCSPAGTW